MRSVSLFLIVLAAFSARTTSAGSNPGVPWPATDALGRSLPAPAEVGPPRADRFVGIFYFLWHDQGKNVAKPEGSPYDVSKIFAADPDALKKPTSLLWGPVGMMHYWGEPLFGYYRADDPWVLRRHAHLLADAGIDALIFDTTNAVTYRDTYRKLCEVFTQVRAEGGRTPQIAFMVNTQAGTTANRIYEDLYKPGDYRDLWFQWKGKPLLICDPNEASSELREFFTLRKAHWPFQMIDTKNAWHWEAAYPQPYGYTDDPNVPEQVNVSVAQNLRASDGKVTNMSEGNARGRSFHDGQVDQAPGAVNWGHNAAEQWRRAIELGPPFVMVTGWNEWIAGRFGKPEGPIVFVDQFSEEYSRDIEPMKGGHGDNYYYQMVANVRRYKGAPPLPVASAPKMVHIEGGFEQWNDVTPEYTDHVGVTLPRDHDGVGGFHYEDHSGRNDFVVMKVARDDREVFFLARCTDSIVPDGLRLFIDSDQNAKTGWEGYDFLIERDSSNGSFWLQKNAGGWKWEKVTKLDCRVEGKELQLAVPRNGNDHR